jgi:predicted amidohydrolase
VSTGELRVGLAQWRATPGAPAENLRAASELIERAGRAGCHLVVLPELWACGYAPATLADDAAAAAEPLDGPRGQALAALAGHHSLWLAALRAAGARLVIEPAAYEFAAESWWERLYPGHALANGQWWILVNQAGGDAGTGCFGRSRVLSPTGEVVAEASRAAEGSLPDPELVVVDIALDPDADGGVLFGDRPVDPVASVVSSVP